VTGGEGLNVDTFGEKGLHLRGDPDGAIVAFTPVERADTNRVTSNAEIASSFVPNSASKDPIESIPNVIGVAVFLVEVADNGRVGFRGDFDTCKLVATDFLVVVYFTVPVGG
jgi:hypothetical protein